MRKESDSNLYVCVICKEIRDFYSYGVCEHRGVCSICSLRSRLLYQDKKCPICTTKLENVYVYDVGEEIPYSEANSQKKYMYENEYSKVYFA